MRIVDLSDLEQGCALTADLVIIGTGPAGLSVMRELRETSLKIIMVESGVLEPRAEYSELNRLECEPNPYFDAQGGLRREYHGFNCSIWDPDIEPYGVRIRAFGGSSAYWGGKATTFAPIDFMAREWVPNSGWPISFDALAGYFERAGEVLNLGPHVYDNRLWSMLKKPAALGFEGRNLSSTFWQFARSSVDGADMVRFGKEYASLDAPNATVLLNATATRIDLNDRRDAFSAIEVATLDGRRHRITASQCVIAASAVETPRLLLASRHQIPTGIGNGQDLVGRYLMDHPSTKIGTIAAANMASVMPRFGFFALKQKLQPSIYMHGLSMNADIQQSEGLLHSSIFFLEGVAADDPYNAFVRLAKRKSLRPHQDFMSVLSGLGFLARSIGKKILDHRLFPGKARAGLINMVVWLNPNFVVREYQTRDVPRKIDRVDVFAIAEQFPNLASRVSLAATVDRLGVPTAKVDWNLTAFEARSIMRTGQLLRDDFAAAGLGPIDLVPWIKDGQPQDAVLMDSAHSLGTTRMAHSAEEGVVDVNCQIFGIDGLFVAGGSVMPTSGHANPTLMIISLAIRLADHIKSIWADSGGPDPEDLPSALELPSPA